MPPGIKRGYVETRSTAISSSTRAYTSMNNIKATYFCIEYIFFLWIFEKLFIQFSVLSVTSGPIFSAEFSWKNGLPEIKDYQKLLWLEINWWHKISTYRLLTESFTFSLFFFNNCPGLTIRSSSRPYGLYWPRIFQAFRKIWTVLNLNVFRIDYLNLKDYKLKIYLGIIYF